MPCFEPVLMMRPGRPRAIMPGANTCEPLITPHRLTPRMRCQFGRGSEHLASGLNAGVVHQDIRAAEPFAHRGFEPRNVIEVADIGHRSHHAGSTLRRHFGQCRCSLRKFVRSNVGDTYPQAQTRKLHRRRQADAGRASGDDGNVIRGQRWMRHVISPRCCSSKACSPLRSHHPLRALRAENMMVQIGDPLPAGSRHVQIFYAVVEMHRDAVPEKRRISFDDIGGRGIAELPIGADLLEFIVKRVGLARIQADRRVDR